MRARRLLAVLGSAVVLAGCGGIPKVSPGSSDSAPPATVATIGPGTVMGDALTEAHCARAPSGIWMATGVVKNTTKQTRSFDVNIYVGPADGNAGVAQVVPVKNVAAGKSAPWKATAVQATAPGGPCYIRVRIAK